MVSFANKLRMKQPNDTVASSIYQLPTPNNQAVEVPEGHVHIGYEQGTAIPLVMEKKKAMQIVTRGGKILDAESKSQLADVVETREVDRGSKDDWEIVYNSPAASPTVPGPSREPKYEERRKSLARLTGTYGGSNDSPPPFISKDEAFNLNDETRVTVWARRDQRQHEYLNSIGWTPADELFDMPEETAHLADDHQTTDPEQVEADEYIENQRGLDEIDLNDLFVVPESKDMPTASYSPPAPPLGVYRQRVIAKQAPRPILKRFKAMFTRRRRLSGTDISGPIFETFKNRGPVGVDYVDGLHPAIKAIPIDEAQQRFRRPAQIEQETPGIFNYFADANSSNDSSVGSHKQPPRSVISGLVKTGKARIVGRPSQGTLFEDFINLGGADYSESEDADKVIPAHPLRRRPGMISAWRLDKTLPLTPSPSLGVPEPMPPIPEPLRVGPKRKPVREGKHIDASQYDWVPQATIESPIISSLPHRISSTNYMFDETTTIDDLFDDIDQQVAAMDIPNTAKPAVNKEAHRLNKTFGRPAPGSMGVDDEDMEPTITLDTFVHDGHTSFVATERNGQLVYSDYRRFRAEDHDDGDGDFEDEAAHRMEQLRRLRNGLDARTDDNEWWVKVNSK